MFNPLKIGTMDFFSFVMLLDFQMSVTFVTSHPGFAYLSC